MVNLSSVSSTCCKNAVGVWWRLNSNQTLKRPSLYTFISSNVISQSYRTISFYFRKGVSPCRFAIKVSTVCFFLHFWPAELSDFPVASSSLMVVNLITNSSVLIIIGFSGLGVPKALIRYLFSVLIFRWLSVCYVWLNIIVLKNYSYEVRGFPM